MSTAVERCPIPRIEGSFFGSRHHSRCRKRRNRRHTDSLGSRLRSTTLPGKIQKPIDNSNRFLSAIEVRFLVEWLCPTFVNLVANLVDNRNEQMVPNYRLVQSYPVSVRACLAWRYLLSSLIYNQKGSSYAIEVNLQDGKKDVCGIGSKQSPKAQSMDLDEIMIGYEVDDISHVSEYEPDLIIIPIERTPCLPGLSNSTEGERQCTGQELSSTTSKTSTSAAAHTSSSSSKQASLPSRKKVEPDEDGDEGDDDTDGPTSSTAAARRTQRRFACPYYKRCPGEYHDSRACRGPGWASVHHVKLHLYRRHRRPHQCLRCFEIFADEQNLMQHQRSVDGCSIREGSLAEGFDAKQEELLRSRKRKSSKCTEEDKWREMYQILFPEDNAADMPSPCMVPFVLQNLLFLHDAS
jgi:hypothetical protein